MRPFLTAICPLAVLAVAGCAGDSTSSGQGKPAEGSARESVASVSALPHSYTYELDASCGERSLTGTYRVVVRDGKVVSATTSSGEEVDDLGDVPTLAELVLKAESASDEAKVDLDLDDAGLPQRIEIDHLPEAIDEEECYEVRDITPLR